MLVVECIEALSSGFGYEHKDYYRNIGFGPQCNVDCDNHGYHQWFETGRSHGLSSSLNPAV